MARSAVVKIDLCGSKKFMIDRKSPDSRVEVLKRLTKIAVDHFPYADNRFPQGSLYNPAGDAIYIILERPTVALKKTIEFMKRWSSEVPNYPDCRAVIDYNEITEVNVANSVDLVGEIFEDINEIEKLYGAGEIGVTDRIVKHTDTTIIGFIKPVESKIKDIRKIKSWAVNYDNPRTLNMSMVAHALFIASPESAKVRERAIEAIIIDVLMSKGKKNISIIELINYLEKNNYPYISDLFLEEIINTSEYLELFENKVSLKNEMHNTFNSISNEFEKSKSEAVNYIVGELSRKLSLENKDIEKGLKISELTEEYLSAIFLEIRMIANHYSSKDLFFEDLISKTEFDYIIKKFVSELFPEEAFLYFKKIYLSSLLDLTVKENVYIASIFHNVLLLYYLNRNPELTIHQKNKINKKGLFLDTNTFYALKCKSSQFNKLINLVFARLRAMDCRFYIFDKSIEEFNGSLANTSRKYRSPNQYLDPSKKPWIRKEFESYPHEYAQDFDFCVKSFQVPKNEPYPKCNYSVLSQELLKQGLNAKKLDSNINKEEFDKLYERIYEAKKKLDPETQWYGPNLPEDLYQALVSHDTLCLLNLYNKATSPFDADKLFITCDYGLVKLRNRFPGEYEYIVAINEFYEFMLPYLFISNTVNELPISIPNLLLGAIIHKEAFSIDDFDALIGKCLSDTLEDPEKYCILSEVKSTSRYKEIKNKYKRTNTQEAAFEVMSQLEECSLDYAKRIADLVSSGIAKKSIIIAEKRQSDLTIQLKEKDSEIESLKMQLDFLKQKDKRLKKYDRKIQRHSK